MLASLLRRLGVRRAPDPTLPPIPTVTERAYQLKPGFAWNPLRSHRNLRCPCESGRKVKKCCGRFEALPKDVVDKLNAVLEARSGD